MSQSTSLTGALSAPIRRSGLSGRGTNGRYGPTDGGGRFPDTPPIPSTNACDVASEAGSTGPCDGQNPDTQTEPGGARVQGTPADGLIAGTGRDFR